MFRPQVEAQEDVIALEQLFFHRVFITACECRVAPSVCLAWWYRSEHMGWPDLYFRVNAVLIFARYAQAKRIPEVAVRPVREALERAHAAGERGECGRLRAALSRLELG